MTAEADPSKTASADTYVAHVDASTLTWHSTKEGTSTTKVAVLVVALSSKDKILSHTLQSMSVITKGGADMQTAGKTADFLIISQLPKSVERLRFVVRETNAGRMGTADLTLPAKG